MLDAARKELDARVGEIRRMEQETAGLVGAIGLAGTAKSYGDEIKEQRAAADRWRLATIVLSVLAVAGVIIVASTLGRDAQWEEFVGNSQPRSCSEGLRPTPLASPPATASAKSALATSSLSRQRSVPSSNRCRRSSEKRSAS